MASVGQVVTSLPPRGVARVKAHYDELCAGFAGPDGVLSLPHTALLAHGRA